MLKKEGVSRYSSFSLVQRRSKWGASGVLQYQDLPVAEAPTYRALLDWTKDNIAPEPSTDPANSSH